MIKDEGKWCGEECIVESNYLYTCVANTQVQAFFIPLRELR
jgi:hypothetical protein